MTAFGEQCQSVWRILYMGYHRAPVLRVSGRPQGPQAAGAKAVRGFIFQWVLDGEWGVTDLGMESLRIPSRNKRQFSNVAPQETQARYPTAVTSGSSPSKEWLGRVGWTAAAKAYSMGIRCHREASWSPWVGSRICSSLGMADSSIRASCSRPPLPLPIQQRPLTHTTLCSAAAENGVPGAGNRAWEDPCLQFCHLQFWDRKS